MWAVVGAVFFGGFLVGFFKWFSMGFFGLPMVFQWFSVVFRISLGFSSAFLSFFWVSRV